MLREYRTIHINRIIVEELEDIAKRNNWTISRAIALAVLALNENEVRYGGKGKEQGSTTT
jgi:hypothetical protein